MIVILNKSYRLNSRNSLFFCNREVTDYLEFAEIHFFLYLLGVVDYLEFAEIRFILDLLDVVGYLEITSFIVFWVSWTIWKLKKSTFSSFFLSRNSRISRNIHNSFFLKYLKKFLIITIGSNTTTARFLLVAMSVWSFLISQI